MVSVDDKLALGTLRPMLRSYTRFMRKVESLTTQRLLLRRWQESDIAPFAALNADPEVMRYFPSPVDEQQTLRMVDRFEHSFETYGHGPWAVEFAGACIGFIGLLVVDYEVPFSPCVEIGWRLAKHAWGQGLAPEGARAVLQDGFQRLHMPEVVSFTSKRNTPSSRVMEKIGMHYASGEGFLHPKVSQGHVVQAHIP